MWSYSIILLVFSILEIATASASSICRNGTCYFPSDDPTCGKDETMNQFNTTTTVTVQPDCDTVIDTICRAVVKGETPAPTSNLNLGHTFGTCEGHIVISVEIRADISY